MQNPWDWTTVANKRGWPPSHKPALGCFRENQQQRHCCWAQKMMLQQWQKPPHLPEMMQRGPQVPCVQKSDTDLGTPRACPGMSSPRVLLYVPVSTNPSTQPDWMTALFRLIRGLCSCILYKPPTLCLGNLLSQHPHEMIHYS